MINSYIGYSTDEEIRFKATSGGVGTALVRFLFDSKRINGALTFYYDQDLMIYVPKIVESFAEYRICGSIYQEVDIVKCLREYIRTVDCVVKKNILLFCLPCQVKLIRNICEKSQLGVIIVGLTCSSQQKIGATYYLLSRLKIEKNHVSHIQYRGNGWPSGIQIQMKSGEKKFVKNNGSLWRDIFHSKLFVMKRCFGCDNTLNDYADISLADPWLKDYSQNERIGQTLFFSQTVLGQTLINACLESGSVIAKQVENILVEESQKKTILRKRRYKENPKLRGIIIKIVDNTYYRKAMHNSFFFSLHCKALNFIENRILKKL